MLARRDFLRPQSLPLAPDSELANPASVVDGSPMERIIMRISLDGRWVAFKIAVNPQSNLLKRRYKRYWLQHLKQFD